MPNKSWAVSRVSKRGSISPFVRPVRCGLQRVTCCHSRADRSPTGAHRGVVATPWLRKHLLVTDTSGQIPNYCGFDSQPNWRQQMARTKLPLVEGTLQSAKRRPGSASFRMSAFFSSAIILAWATQSLTVSSTRMRRSALIRRSMATSHRTSGSCGPCCATSATRGRSA